MGEHASFTTVDEVVIPVSCSQEVLGQHRPNRIYTVRGWFEERLPQQPDAVDVAMEDREASHLVMTNCKIMKGSNKTFPDQMSRLIHGVRC